MSYGDTQLEINMTPLIDVMLVVLVLFMITAPLAPDEPEVTLPQVSADEIPLKDTPAVAIVTQAGRVFFRGRDVTGSVESALLNDPLLQHDKRLYVRGDRETKFSKVSNVLAAARRAGVKGINLVVDPSLRTSPAPRPESHRP